MIPAVGSLVDICTPETRGKRLRVPVATNTTSGGRPAFTVLGFAGVFVDSYEGECWWSVQDVLPAVSA